MSSLAGAPPPHCNAAFPSTRRTLRIHGTRTTPNPVELPGDPWHSQPLCFPHRTRAPRAIAPGAPTRGLSFWRWCSLRSETAWLCAHGRLWRLVVRARPLARIAPSQARDTTPAALPRSHRRRLLPPLPPAPPLRPRPPRRTQPRDPSKRAPPVAISHYRPRPCRLARTCSTRSLSRCHATYLRTRCCRLARRSVPWTCAMSCRYRYSPASSRPASPYARRRRILSLRET